MSTLVFATSSTHKEHGDNPKTVVEGRGRTAYGNSFYCEPIFCASIKLQQAVIKEQAWEKYIKKCVEIQIQNASPKKCLITSAITFKKYLYT